MASKQRRVKHVPQRSCIVCREKTEKRGLTRLVRSADEVIVDASGRLPGRGAYLCDRTACWNRALQSGLLERALRTTLTTETRATLAEHQPQKND